jgi:protein-tyrosine phosphatase
MIDIHSHILWGLDDGAETLEESLAMLKMAADSGTTDIVATPHASFRYRFQPEVVKQRLEEIAAAVAGKPRVHSGCDFHLSFDNVQDALENPTRYSVNGGSYLLVEFPDSTLAGMDRIINALLDRGLIPIITHPERNAHLRKISSEFLEWVQKGCLVQVTAQSLLGRFGKSAQETGWEMVERGIAHVIASDAHDLKDRPPRLDAAYAAIAERLDESRARQLCFENPRAVITGDTVYADTPKRKSWFRWRK